MANVSVPVRFQAFSRFAVDKLQRQNAHADQVAAVNSFVTLGDDRFYALHKRAFRRPVAGRAGAVFLAGKNAQRYAGFFIFHRGIEKRHPFAGRMINRHIAFNAGHQQVTNANIGESAASSSPDRCPGANRNCSSLFVLCLSPKGITPQESRGRFDRPVKYDRW